MSEFCYTCNRIVLSPLINRGVLWTTRHYPCGCSAAGEGDVPNYCAQHGSPAGSVPPAVTTTKWKCHLCDITDLHSHAHLKP